MKISNLYLLSDTHIILRWECGNQTSVELSSRHPFEPEVIVKALKELIQKIETLHMEQKTVKGFAIKDLKIGKGITYVDHLPFEAPWIGPYGSCFVNIIDIRRNENKVIEFQLGDENAIPYENGNVWVKADDFYSEWPK